ncbi:MAG: nuclear transport factor 2 family protein [Ottowia sp.]
MTLTLQQIQDRFALKHLVDHFSNLADVKDVDAQLPLFAEDAQVETYIKGELFANAQGRAEIGEVFKNYLAQFHTVYHLNGQQTVEFTGEDSAEGITYCQVALVAEKDGKDEMLTHYVRYSDSYARIGGEWLIQKRVANFMYSETLKVEK